MVQCKAKRTVLECFLRFEADATVHMPKGAHVLGIGPEVQADGFIRVYVLADPQANTGQCPFHVIPLGGHPPTNTALKWLGTVRPLGGGAYHHVFMSLGSTVPDNLGEDVAKDLPIQHVPGNDCQSLPANPDMLLTEDQIRKASQEPASV